MMRRIAVCLVSLVITAPVWAHEKESKPDTGGSGMPMDMTQMGPWTRKPTNEAKTRKEIEAFFKEEEALMKKGDLTAAIARVDFPFFGVTDDRNGIPKTDIYDRQKYEEMMKSMLAQMPKDMEITRNTKITVLSDSLAMFTCDFTTTMGKEKLSGRNAGVMVKRDGQWKWKAMFEAGWGDYPSEAVGGSGTPSDQEKPK